MIQNNFKCDGYTPHINKHISKILHNLRRLKSVGMNIDNWLPINISVFI